MGHGTRIDGGFTRYCCAREEVVCRLPEHFDYDSGTLCEPLACVYQTVVELTNIVLGDVVVVSGPGPMGLLCMMLAKTRGATVVMLGTTVDEKRIELARQLGADAALNIDRTAPGEIITALTAGEGADVVVECAGVAASVNPQKRRVYVWKRCE